MFPGKNNSKKDKHISSRLSTNAEEENINTTTPAHQELAQLGQHEQPFQYTQFGQGIRLTPVYRDQHGQPFLNRQFGQGVQLTSAYRDQHEQPQGVRLTTVQRAQLILSNNGPDFSQYGGPESSLGAAARILHHRGIEGYPGDPSGVIISTPLGSFAAGGREGLDSIIGRMDLASARKYGWTIGSVNVQQPGIHHVTAESTMHRRIVTEREITITRKVQKSSSHGTIDADGASGSSSTTKIEAEPGSDTKRIESEKITDKKHASGSRSTKDRGKGKGKEDLKKSSKKKKR